MSAIDYLQQLKKSHTGEYARNWLDEAIKALEQKPKLIPVDQKELNKIRQELLNRSDQCITFKDLVERFDSIDAEFNHSPLNLLQIYSNFNILIGKNSEDR